ncbi:MAG: hypothetical protein OXC29_28275 [Rhodococcus sp.]|nr:hypothetical protein [Rhodococcus sp. (in: high G+C Gram-positive bacteria)]
MPAGPSVWELSSKESPGKKADDDYTDRTADPMGWDMAKSSYVQVSLRPWLKRGPWATDRSAERQWREVRALGLDDIVAWLNEAPETELWLADLLNLHPSELTRGSKRWWEDRVGTAPIGIYGRVRHPRRKGYLREEFVDQLEGDKGSVTVEAESIEAALEFIAAAANGPLGSEDTGSLLDRMVFVHGPNAWHRLHGESGRSLVLVACDPGLAELTPDDVHTSVFPVQESGGSFSARRTRDGSRDCVAVPRLDGRLDAGALDTGEARACGINNPEARRLGVVGGRSADALRRQLSVSPAIRIPAWATVDSQAGICVVRAKTAALLAGDWSGVRSESAAGRADRDVVASLAGGDLDYETVQLTLQPFSVGPDPMLRYDGSTWRLVAPREAWQLSAPSLVDRGCSLERFFDVARRMLQRARSSRRPWTPDDRIVVSCAASAYRYSADLRYGIARSLSLLFERTRRRAGLARGD